jgi:diguanylate cyclase (GGDEF)-like protein
VARIAEVEEDLDRLLEGLKRRPAIVALAQASSDALAIESPGSVALRLAYQLERVLDAPVVVASRTGEQVIVAGVSGRADRRLVDRALPADAPLAAVARGEAAGGRLDGAPLGAAREDRRTSPEAVLLLPIEAARERVGAVALWLPGGAEPIGARLAEIHECVRDAAPRLRSALAHHAERSKATTDRLTGLANRDVLERAMNREGGAAAGVLIALDIDHFKRLNDTLGHPAGDAALVHVARLLKGQVRASDVAARVGGEEFMLWLPNAPLAVGEQIAERIRARLADTVWEWRGSAWPVTASFGVAGAPDSSRSAANLPELADRALYQAKQEGRNRVRVSRGA